MSEGLGTPLLQLKRGFAGRVISMSSTTFDELVRSNMINVPGPVSIVVEPHLWTSSSADRNGEWHALGRALVLGLLTDTIEVHIWCLTTDGETPLDPEVEGNFVLDYITDELIPLLGSSGVNAAIADLFTDDCAPIGPFGNG